VVVIKKYIQHGNSFDCTTFGERNDYRMDRKKGLDGNKGERRERDKGG
jgi:hypothetical protein